MNLIDSHFPEPRVQLASTYHEEPMAELADEIEHVKALILEKLDDLNALRTKLREEYVPLTVCNHLEQCIKETEVPSLFFSSNLIIYSHWICTGNWQWINASKQVGKAEFLCLVTIDKIIVLILNFEKIILLKKNLKFHTLIFSDSSMAPLVTLLIYFKGGGTETT